MTRRLAVIGGGIAGLAAAWEAVQPGDDVEVVVHEASDRLGGKLVTSLVAGRPVDEGADAFLARVPEAVQLCHELGIAAELVAPATGRAYVYSRESLHPLPAGIVLGVPTDLAAAEASGILTEPIPHRPWPAPLGPGDDVAVGTIVRDQLGAEVLERLVDPMLGGINAGDADRMSLRTTAPQLAAAAETDGDLVRALRNAPPPEPGPVFLAPRGGMQGLVDSLAVALRAEGADLRTGTAVHDLDAVDADAVVLAVPAPVAATLLERAVPPAARMLAAIESVDVVLVTFAVRAADVGRPLDGSGFLVPRPEKLLMTACSWASSKWADLARDDGLVLLRASAGRVGDQRVCQLADDAVVTELLADLGRTMDLGGEPVDVRVSRWPAGFPQYRPGHLDSIAHAEAAMTEQAPRVALAGAALRGVGVPACIRSGRRAAARLRAEWYE